MTEFKKSCGDSVGGFYPCRSRHSCGDRGGGCGYGDYDNDDIDDDKACILRAYLQESLDILTPVTKRTYNVKLTQKLLARQTLILNLMTSKIKSLSVTLKIH